MIIIIIITKFSFSLINFSIVCSLSFKSGSLSFIFFFKPVIVSSLQNEIFYILYNIIN